MNIKKNAVLFAMLLSFLSIEVAKLNCQVLTGNIKGIVKDESGAALPGVTVEISSPVLMGGIHLQIANDKGEYRFVNLPPGSYKVIYGLQGFQKIERLDIKVVVGGTVTEDIVLKQTTLEESVTVTGRAPIVDVSKTGISTTFDKDLLEKIPTGRRSFLDIAINAPGIVAGTAYEDNIGFIGFGSNAEANSIQLDGLEITNPRLGTTILVPNQDVFSEVEVKGTGAPAEYGSFTGIVVNIVTKSGGNTFSGSASYYGQFAGLTADNNPDPGNVFSYARHKFFDLAFTLGGPLLKDRLWFFGSVNLAKNAETFWKSDPKYFSETKDNNYFFKLSAQIANAHKLTAGLSYRDWAQPGVPTPWILASSLDYFKRHSPNWNILYTWLISSSTYFELKAAGLRDPRTRLPMGSTLDDSCHVDLLTGVMSGAAILPLKGRHTRFQTHASISHFADNFLGGSHDFKIGVQYTDGEHHQICAYSGNNLYLDYGGQPYLLYTQEAFYYGGQVKNLGAFIDDSWSVGKRVTVNLGLRYDSIHGNVPKEPLYVGWHPVQGKTQPAVNNLIVWNLFSPRIGFVYQLTADKKTILKAHFGRYYDALSTGTYEWPGPYNTDWLAYFWSGSAWELYNFVPGPSSGTIDPNLKAPYADQISIGLEREIFSDFSLGITGVYKSQKNSMSIWNIGAEYEIVPRVSADNGKTYMVYNQLNLGKDVYQVTNPEGFGQTYRGLIFAFNKRLSHNWLLNASFTISRSEGLINSSGSNLEGNAAAQQNTVIGTLAYNTGKDRNDYLNAKGLLPNDRPFFLKLQLGYIFPWDISASLNYQYMTGIPYATRIRVETAQGRRRIFSEPRSGKNRFAPLNVLDLRLMKAFSFYRTLRLSAMFDVFNVFNINTVTDYASSDFWSTSYKLPLAIPRPRRVQLGLKLEF